MDPQRPWDDAQIKQAAEDLAILTVADRLMSEKQAAGFADALRGFANTARDYAGDAWQNLPHAAKNPLLYAGVGAAGGGLLGGLSSFARDPEERRPFRSALSGALAGAAGGAGLGLLRDQMPADMERMFGLQSAPKPKPPQLTPGGPSVPLSQLSDEQLNMLAQRAQRRLERPPIGEAVATAAGAGAGATAGIRRADAAKLQSQGFDRNTSMLQRGAAGLEPDKLYKGDNAQTNFVRKLQQPGGFTADQLREIELDALSKQRPHTATPRPVSPLPSSVSPMMPSFSPEDLAQGHGVGSKSLPLGESPHVPGVSRESIRGLHQRGRVAGRATPRARAIGGGIGGVAGGLLGNLGYNYFFPNE